jgi:hypothetical protein
MKINYAIRKMISYHSFGIGWGDGLCCICFWKWILELDTVKGRYEL